MKKIISSLLAMAMLLSVSFSAFALETATLSVTDITDVKVGDIVEAVITVDTTAGIGSYTATIKWDKEVFDLVPSEAFNTFAADPENKAMAEEFEMTIEDVYKEMTGFLPVVSDAYLACWETNASKIIPGMSQNMTSDNYLMYKNLSENEISKLKAVKNAVIAAVRLQAKKEVASTTISTTEPVKNSTLTVAGAEFPVAPVSFAVKGDAPATANVTVADNANALVEVSKTGEVAIGEEITVSVKPMAGFEIVDAFDDALLGMGGEITFAVTEDIEIAVTAAEDDAKPAVVAIAFVEDFGASDCVTFFGKAPASAAEFGIDIGATFFNEAQAKEYGPKLAAKSMSAAGFYGVKIHNLPEGEYNVSAYADAANSAAFAFAK